jgi:hypothetical protein
MDRITNPGQVDDNRLWTDGDPDEDIEATPIAAKYMNDLQEEVCNAILGFGLALNGAEQNQLHQAIVKAISEANTTSAVVDKFPVSGTWTKRPGAKFVHMLLIGGGGGGDSGAVAAAGAVAIGGDSGGGGAVFLGGIPADGLPNSCAITIGKGGLGGPTSMGAKNKGGAGGDTMIYGGTNYLFAARGANQDISPGILYTYGMFNGESKTAAITTGGVQTGSTRYNSPGIAARGMPAGEAGAGLSASGPVYAGTRRITPSAMVGISTIVVSAASPHGTDAKAYLDGFSGSGGDAFAAANGGDGGNGGKYGCGGGGGGGARTGFTAGKGGDGGDGIAVITTFF